MADNIFVNSVTACNVCGGEKLRFNSRRSDGVCVLECEDCGMGVLEKFPDNPSVLYEGGYYLGADSSPESGYSDYSDASEHGVLWASEMLKAMKSGGRVLDVGCANGFLLNSLGGEFETYGIEANTIASAIAESAGVKIIGSDILEPSLVNNYSGYFNAITAIAVFEHVVDFRKAVESSLKMLKPDGILIFEVPLMSESQNNETWLNSSHEHLFYPTVKGLTRLFDVELKVPMVGYEAVIRDYASTFIGFVAKEESVFAEKALIFDQIVAAKDLSDSRVVRRAQLLLSVIHKADSKPGHLKFVNELFPSLSTTPFLSRCLDVWRTDSAKLENLRDYVNTLEKELFYREPNGAILAERDEALAERDEALAERDEALAERDELLAELYNVYRSKSWVFTKPLRFALSSTKLFRQILRQLYQVRLRSITCKRVKSALRLLIDGRLAELQLAFSATVRGDAKWSKREKSVEFFVCPQLDYQQPLVSVIIPCFNYGKFVLEAIDSVLAQTLKNLEILVIDGGSTDIETLRTLQAIQRPKTRIVFREGRHFVGDNRNYGIGLASGRYICCLDADDTIDPTYLEKAAFYLETYGYDIVSTSINFVGARAGCCDTMEYPDLRDMTEANHVLTCAVFRKRLWESVGGYVDVGIGKHHVAEDWDFWVKLSAQGARIRNISREYLFNYRIHEGGSLSSSSDVKSLSEQKKIILNTNQSLLTDSSFKYSEDQQARYLRCESSQSALASSFEEDPHRMTLLLAMPYFLVGGAERLLSGLCQHLASQGWRVIVISTLDQEAAHGTSIDWFKLSSSEVYSLPRFLDSDERADFVAYLIASRRVDCVLNTGSRLLYELLPTLKLANPNLCVIDFLFNKIGHIESHLEYKEYISYALAENDEVFDWYLQVAGWPSTRVAMLLSGVNLVRYKPKPRPEALINKYHIAQGDIVVGFSGRFSEEKAPEVFLEVAALCRDCKTLRFIMTGAGPLSESIAKMVKELPVGTQLELAGLVHDVDEYLALYDLLVLPSRMDGRPLVVMEAMACGVPVIASNVGGLSSLINNGDNGYLVAPANAKEIAGRILELVKDRSLLAELKDGARKMAVEKLDENLAHGIFEASLKKAANMHKENCFTEH